MDSANKYGKQYCPIHKIQIMYFKTNKLMDETQCWDCRREANKKKLKNENSISPILSEPISIDGDD